MTRRSSQAAAGQILNVATLLVVSLIGIAAFVFPFAQFRDPGATAGRGPAGTAHAQDAALMFVVLIVLSMGAVMGNMVGSNGGLNAKMVASLGVLTAVNAVLRVVPGPAGFSAMYALPILCGYCYGATFGYLLGVLSMAVSALLGAGIGPWLPFQMFVMGWIGLTSSWLPRLPRWPRFEVVMLAAWGLVWGIGFGFVLNVWFWPFIYDSTQAGLYWQPGVGLVDGFRRYLAFYVVTSVWWDIGRAAGNVVLIGLFGAPVLRLLRRFGRRFTFERSVL